MENILPRKIFFLEFFCCRLQRDYSEQLFHTKMPSPRVFFFKIFRTFSELLDIVYCKSNFFVEKETFHRFVKFTFMNCKFPGNSFHSVFREFLTLSYFLAYLSKRIYSSYKDFFVLKPHGFPITFSN